MIRSAANTCLCTGGLTLVSRGDYSEHIVSTYELGARRVINNSYMLSHRQSSGMINLLNNFYYLAPTIQSLKRTQMISFPN